MLRGRIFLFIALLAVPSWAAAETMSFGDASAMLARGCGADIVANCRGVNLDSNRLKECLSRNRDVISPQCRGTYLEAVDAIQKRIAARVTVANACRNEIVKICHGSTKETSKSVSCLMTANINRNCAQALTDAGYR